MSAARWIVPLSASLFLCACGLSVPEIQENPTNQVGGQLLVKAIVNSVHCDLKNAVLYALGPSSRPQNRAKKQAFFTSDWGAQMALTLTVEEKWILNPVVVVTPMTPPSQVFTLGLGATVSADATRKETLNLYYTVADLRSGRPCPEPNNLEPNAPREPLLLQNDLKLKEWLLDEVMLVGTNEIGAPIDPGNIYKQNVLQHEVKFEVITNGTLAPALKLVTSNVNQSGTFFSTTRDRTHDLIVTFGPVDRHSEK